MRDEEGRRTGERARGDREEEEEERGIGDRKDGN